MKVFNLKIIIIALLAFSFGVVSVWANGGFSYLNPFLKQNSSILQAIPEGSVPSLKSISVETEKLFITRELRFEDYPVAKVLDKESKEKLDCNKPNEYNFVVVENLNRKNDGDYIVPEDLNIVIGEKVIAKIELPIADSEAKNFSLNSVEKDKEGFEIKVNWGGGNYQHEIQYNFKCKENNFYLYKVKKEFFYTKNPDSGNFLDGRKTKITEIKPNLPIEKFVMTDYLQ